MSSRRATPPVGVAASARASRADDVPPRDLGDAVVDEEPYKAARWRVSLVDVKMRWTSTSWSDVAKGDEITGSARRGGDKAMKAYRS